MDIVSLAWQDTMSIRQAVLWPSKPVEFCHVNGDEVAAHFGVMLNKQLVSVASIYKDSDFENTKSVRLRKFATLGACQGKGIGTHLLKHIMGQLQSNNVLTLWCDAREEAVGFYLRLGLQAQGARFYKSGVAYFKMKIIFKEGYAL